MRTENSRHAQTVALIAWFDVAVLLSHLLEDPPQGVVYLYSLFVQLLDTIQQRFVRICEGNPAR
jgi:hypothetical protein